MLSFVVLPTCHGLAWTHHGANWYVPALSVWQGGGPLLALAALRWRRPEARLLLGLAIVPQNFIWYDQLLLFLVPTRPRELWTLCVLSWVSMVVAHYYFIGRDPRACRAGRVSRSHIVALLYLPALAMTLRRPNEGGCPRGSRSASRGCHRGFEVHPLRRLPKPTSAIVFRIEDTSDGLSRRDCAVPAQSASRRWQSNQRVYFSGLSTTAFGAIPEDSFPRRFPCPSETTADQRCKLKQPSRFAP